MQPTAGRLLSNDAGVAFRPPDPANIGAFARLPRKLGPLENSNESRSGGLRKRIADISSLLPPPRLKEEALSDPSPAAPGHSRRKNPQPVDQLVVGAIAPRQVATGTGQSLFVVDTPCSNLTASMFRSRIRGASRTRSSVSTLAFPPSSVDCDAGGRRPHRSLVRHVHRHRTDRKHFGYHFSRRDSQHSRIRDCLRSQVVVGPEWGPSLPKAGSHERE